MNLKLPDATVQFLSRNGQFNYDVSACEPGEVGLKCLEDLTVGEVWVNTDGAGDPNSGAEGYYSIPAVSLTGKCESYDPEFILLWLPNEKLFGTWDCDHAVLTVFPDANWAQIVANPAVYLNAQWDSDPSVGVPLEPWHSYELKPGRPF